MSNRKRDKQITRRQLLRAAGEVFAEKGYHGASTRDICLKADANFAAINYHFRDKEGLYQAVIEDIIDSMFKDNPIPKFDPTIPAKTRLSMFIQSALYRMFQQDRPDWVWHLMSWELAHPSKGIDLVVEKVSKPLNSILLNIVRELLGSAAPERVIWLCTASIIGQCFFYRNCQPIIVRLNPDQGFDEASLAELGDHLTRFSLGAIAALRTQIEGNQP